MCIRDRTSGGLLVCVQKEKSGEFEDFSKKHGLVVSAIGRLTEKKEILKRKRRNHENR